MLTGACLGGLVCAAACESREQMMHEAEARANYWGYPAHHVIYDLVYAEYGGRRLKLDLYLPPQGAGAPVPGIVVVRGGAFRAGDKTFFGYVAGQLAEEGFVTASIEYRTTSQAKFPGAVQDVKAAVRWMRAHAGTYGINPNAIGAIGGSAGAHLVAMLATTDAVTELEGTGGNPEVPSSVQAVVAMGGAYDLQWKNVVPQFVDAVTDFIGAPLTAHPDLVAAASPVTYVSSHSAPLLLLHSRTDPVAPFGQAVEMEQAYERAGAFVQLKTIEAPSVHAFWGDPRYWPATRSLVVAFFDKNLKSAVTRR